MAGYQKNTKKSLQQRRKEAKIRRAVFLAIVLFCLFSLFFIVWTVVKSLNSPKEIDKTVSHNSSAMVSETSSANLQSEISSAILSSTQIDSSSSPPSSRQEVSSSKPVTSSRQTVSSKSSTVNSQTSYQQSSDWRMILINKSHPLNSSFSVKLAPIGTLQVDARMLNDYNAMIAAAKADGILFKLISGYRTNAFQTSNFNRQVNKYINQGYTREKAEIEAAKYVAPPGTSEHQTGLAVDLISPDWYNYNSDLNEKFDQTKQFKWLYANCAEYGFILRYLSNKVDITKFSYEPWHYRYVGVENAKKIMASGLCLEEYMNAR